MYYYKKGNQYFAQKSKTDTRNRVEITREVYCICMRPIWREKKRKQRERKCRDKGTSHLINRTVSLDRLEEESGNLPKSATYISPEEHAVREEFHQVLSVAISALDEQDQAIIELFQDGKTEQEIGVTIGMPQTTVHYHKERSFKKIRKILEENQIFLAQSK